VAFPASAEHRAGKTLRYRHLRVPEGFDRSSHGIALVTSRGRTGRATETLRNISPVAFAIAIKCGIGAKISAARSSTIGD
jgi:hypothetical protein